MSDIWLVFLKFEDANDHMRMCVMFSFYERLLDRTKTSGEFVTC